MATTCFGPPPLPPNKRAANSNGGNKDTLNRKNVANNNNNKNSSLTSSTYMSFKDPLDEILVISSEDIQPEKNANKKCHHHHKRKNSLKKCKHALNLSLSKFTDDRSRKMSNDGSLKSANLVNGFDHNYNGDVKTYFLHSPDEPECIPMKTFSETVGRGCEDLTSCDESSDPRHFATVKNTPFARPHSAGRSGFHTNSLTRSFRGCGEIRLSLPRSSSEGNLSNLLDSEVPLSLTPLGSRRGVVALPPDTFPGHAKLNKYFKVFGSWKNLFQLGGMSRGGKPAPQAKRVAPPAVPDAFGGTVPGNAGNVGTQHRLSGTSFGSSQGYASSEDTAFLHPPDTPLAPIRDDHSDYGSTVSGASGGSGGSGKSPGAGTGGNGGGSGGPGGAPPAFTFPPPGTLTHKTAVFYHHQLALQEDQGIDMTQSPGRDSPGSSSGSAGSGSRHSSASLDSGRASGCPAAARCSLSSCSLSSDNTRMDRLLCQGLPDHDLIHAWLSDLHYEEYSPLFITAGYDLPTITRMTPEDLTAIGIKKPNHRKRLKTEIDNLSVPDNLPDYIPGSLEEWLRLLRLEEYGPALVSQGYVTVQDATQLAWEDLEDAGIVRLGHQKKFLLAIKRVKDIRAGKRSISLQNAEGCRMQHPHPGQTHEMLMTPSPLSGGDVTPGSYVHTTQHAYQHSWEVQQSRSINANYHHHQQIQFYQKNHPGVPFNTNQSGTDLVPIQIRQPRGKSLESLEDPSERVTHLTFSPDNTQAYYCTHVNMNQPNLQTWRRSYDDGDITPTNEAAILSNYEGGGTLPRPRGLVKPRPVAKISATAKTVRENVIFQDVNEKSKYIMEGFQNVVYPVDKMGYPLQSQHIAQMRQVYAVSPNMSKKMPPEPPKRQSSNPGIDQVSGQGDHMPFGLLNNMGCYTHTYPSQTYGTTHQTTAEIHVEKGQDPGQKGVRRTLPLSLPAYPSSDSLSSVSLLEGTALSLEPPAPAPASPPRSWGPHGHPTCSLGTQSRNGSDASFKSSSSTESDSLPFANENAGTIKQNRSQVSSRPHTADFGRSNLPLASLPPRHPNTPGSAQSSPGNQSSQDSSACEDKTNPATPKQPHISLSAEPGDVLNDIGNMLANLTDELDAMLEEEKRQGLADG